MQTGDRSNSTPAWRAGTPDTMKRKRAAIEFFFFLSFFFFLFFFFLSTLRLYRIANFQRRPAHSANVNLRLSQCERREIQPVPGPASRVYAHPCAEKPGTEFPSFSSQGGPDSVLALVTPSGIPSHQP